MAALHYKYDSIVEVINMGEVAEMFIEGFYCNECSCIVDGEQPGYSRICEDCSKVQNEKEAFHQLKCHPEYFEAVRSGLKTFEIRYNDRDFKVGDGIRLREFNPTVKKYTGQDLFVKITYISGFKQKNGYVVLGIKRL